MSFGKNSGQFFSVMTIIMILPLLALAGTFSRSLSGYGKEIGSLVRLKSAYYYYNSVDQDLLRAGEIVGKRSVVAALNWVIENGKGFNSSEETLRELFESGTVNGTEQSIMNRSTIYHWLNTTEDISRERGYRLDLNLSFDENNIGMASPWKLRFDLNYSLELSDKRNLFNLRRNLSKRATAPVTGLEDPLVTLRTGGKVIYPIKKVPFNYFTKELATGEGNNSWAAGKSVVVNATTSVDVPNPDEKILVVNQTVSGMDNFAGVVVKEDAAISGFSKPYVEDIGNDFYNISNHTRIVVAGNASPPQVWEIENLYKMWEEGYYVQGDGPSFLDRLENNLTNSYPGKGLNVFLKKEDLQAAGLGVEDRPNLAHIYFSNAEIKNYRVKGMPPSFKVNESNLDRFNLDNTLSLR